MTSGIQLSACESLEGGGPAEGVVGQGSGETSPESLDLVPVPFALGSVFLSGLQFLSPVQSFQILSCWNMLRSEERALPYRILTPI